MVVAYDIYYYQCTNHLYNNYTLSMTTIAWRGRILAADTQLTHSGGIPTLCRKLRKMGHKGCLSIAGNVDDEYIFTQWLLAGGKQDEWPHERMKKAVFEAIYIDQWNDVWFYINNSAPIAMEHEFFAIGQGDRLALAAMQLGMGAKDAVLFASELNVNTNNLVDTYDLQTGKITLSKWPRITPRLS
jgi:hypothetical protein